MQDQVLVLPFQTKKKSTNVLKTPETSTPFSGEMQQQI